MKATLTPFHDNILLTEIPANERTESGLIIPEAHRTPVNQGKVVDKGPNVSDNIQLGDILFFPLHSESRMNYKGNKFIIVPEASCLGAIRELKKFDVATALKNV